MLRQFTIKSQISLDALLQSELLDGSYVSDLVVREPAGCRHTRAPPPRWARTERVRPGSSCHGDGCPGVRWGAGRHWPRPLQLSGSSPAESRRLLVGAGKDTEESCRKLTRMLNWVSVRLCPSPVPCFPGLYPKPCIPDLWEDVEPIPAQKGR